VCDLELLTKLGHASQANYVTGSTCEQLWGGARAVGAGAANLDGLGWAKLVLLFALSATSRFHARMVETVNGLPGR